MYSDMQPWCPQNGAMSKSLFKVSSKPERCSETGSQREQTLVANKSSESKESTRTIMYSDMQPWRPQNGAMSASLYKASSKPERCSETGSQREQTLVANKSSKSKENQD